MAEDAFSCPAKIDGQMTLLVVISLSKVLFDSDKESITDPSSSRLLLFTMTFVSCAATSASASVQIRVVSAPFEEELLELLLVPLPAKTPVGEKTTPPSASTVTFS